MFFVSLGSIPRPLCRGPFLACRLQRPLPCRTTTTLEPPGTFEIGINFHALEHCKYSFNITPGKHLLEWRYQKDFGNSFGEDTAWLDNIDLPLRIGASLALEKNGDTARLRLWGRPGHRYDIEVSTDFSGWVKWDSVFIDSEGVKLLEKEIGLNASATRFFRAVAP